MVATSGRERTTGRRTGRLARGGVLETLERSAQHFAIEKEQGAKGLVLGRGADVDVGSEMGKEGLYLGGAHGLRRPPLAEGQESPGPEEVGLFGSGAVLLDPDREPQALQNALEGFAKAVRCGGRRRGTGPSGSRGELGEPGQGLRLWRWMVS
jgi:hypothetical protein